MPTPSYDRPRPRIPAATRRLVEVEAGHACSIKECGDHSFLELHHIDGNRENNDPANLILLCLKHHEMAHAGGIDRKSLHMHKKRLSASREADMEARLVRLEAAAAAMSLGSGVAPNLPIPEISSDQPVDPDIRKSVARRSSVQAFALCQVAITQYEKDVGVYFERHVEFESSDRGLTLDGLKHFSDDTPDIIIDFVYVRKAYLDAPAYGRMLREKVELYEIMTGREAKGVLLVAVGRENMLGEERLPLIRESVIENGIDLQVYSCGQLGFHPGAVSAALF